MFLKIFTSVKQRKTKIRELDVLEEKTKYLKLIKTNIKHFYLIHLVS